MEITSDTMNTVIEGYPIGTKLLCKMNINSPEESSSRDTTPMTLKQIPVLILDCLFSTPAWVQQTIEAWEKCLIDLDFSQEGWAYMVELGSENKEYRKKIRGLKRAEYRCSEGTCLTATLALVKKILSEHTQDYIYMWIISDGQYIEDKVEFRKIFQEELSPMCNSTNISIRGISIQEGHSSPDTSTLCTFGLLSSKNSTLKEICECTTTQELTNIMRGIPRDNTFSIKTQDGSKTLIKEPGETGKEVININRGDYFLITKAMENIRINKDCAILKVQPSHHTREILNQYTKKTLTRLEREKIAGIYENPDSIQALENLQEELDVQESETRVILESTKLRANLIKMALQKTRRGVKHRLAELKSEQSKVDREGAERIIPRFDNMIEQATQTLSTQKSSIEKATEEIDLPKCFILQESSLETCKVGIQAVMEILDEYGSITAVNCLHLLGLVGIAVKHRIGSYNKPMRLGPNMWYKETITNIYPGVAMNQTSIWDAARRGVTLQAPGFNDEITAVIPIKKWNHPLVWEVYNNITEIGKLQCSAQLRRILKPLDRDKLAMTTATLLKMLEIWPEPSAVQAENMEDTLDSIQLQEIPTEIEEISEELQNKQIPDILFTNNNRLNSDLDPLALILLNKKLLTFMGGPGSEALWRAITSNKIYWRTQAVLEESPHGNLILRLLFKEQFQTHVLPDQVGEPESPEFHNQVDKEYLSYQMDKEDLKPNLTAIRRLHAIAKQLYKRENTNHEAFKEKPTTTAEFQRTCIGYDIDKFIVLEVIKAIMWTKESSRFWKEKGNATRLRIPHPETENEADQQLREIIGNLYRERYKWNAEEKKRRLRQEALEKFMLEVQTTSLEQFAKSLETNMPDVSHPSMSRMSTTIAWYLKIGCDIREVEQKLELLILGKSRGYMWNNGKINSMKKQLLKMLGQVTDQKKLDQITKQAYQRTTHIYREKRNRQNHGNNSPSFWAVTGESQPWSLLKHNPEGYRAFVDEKLKGYENSTSPAEKYLWGKWKHLRTCTPSKGTPDG